MTEPKYQPTDGEPRIVREIIELDGEILDIVVGLEGFNESHDDEGEAEAEVQRVALAIADRVHGAELAALRAEVAALKGLVERLGGDVLLGPIEVAHEELRGAGLDPARVGASGAVLVEVERLRTAMRAIDDVRNSIIGHQTVNWSAHVYPLVAALNSAGYPGAGYDEARADAIRAAAEAERERTDALNWRAVAEHVTRCDGVADTAEDVIELLRCECGDVVCSACCIAQGGESYCPACAAAKRGESVSWSADALRELDDLFVLRRRPERSSPRDRPHTVLAQAIDKVEAEVVSIRAAARGEIGRLRAEVERLNAERAR